MLESSEVSGNQLDQGFFQDNNDDPKKTKPKRKAKAARKAKTPYSPTKIKAKNFLSNVAYRRICDKDFSNICFLIDVFCYLTMDLKPFFLCRMYFEPENRDVIKIMWEECIPAGFYAYIKKPENFELLHSEKLTFKQVKTLAQSYTQMPGTWSEMTRCFSSYHTIYQYIYSLLFPKYYTQSNKYGMRSRIKFALCFKGWRQRKRNEETAKNPFNFAVAEEVIRHPYQQKLITNDDEFKADVPDTRKKLPPSANKENIPPYPSAEPTPTYVYPPTMVGIKKFDKQFKLPKVKKVSKNALQKAEERKKTKKKLILKLAESDEKMKMINKNKNKN